MLCSDGDLLLSFPLCSFPSEFYRFPSYWPVKNKYFWWFHFHSMHALPNLVSPLFQFRNFHNLFLRAKNWIPFGFRQSILPAWRLFIPKGSPVSNKLKPSYPSPVPHHALKMLLCLVYPRYWKHFQKNPNIKISSICPGKQVIMQFLLPSKTQISICL